MILISLDITLTNHLSCCTNSRCGKRLLTV